MRVFVLNSQKQPQMPCHPARARELLRKGKATVFRKYPFTIILHEQNSATHQEVELKIDPGSKITGLALVANCQRGPKVIWNSHLKHRGEEIRSSLESRRMLRRNRRARKTRYRAPRFNNRKRGKGWLPPSLQSRVGNIRNLSNKLLVFCPVTRIAVETVRFDTQKIENPHVAGIQYQQGTLLGYEIREYLLEKWGRKCAYCSATECRLEIDHIIPKSAGGSNRASNLLISCRTCNQKKGNQKLTDFLKYNPQLVKQIERFRKTPLKDAAAVNATRNAVGNRLKELGKPITYWSGGRTKYNRISQSYPKDHWIDAVCVGESGSLVYIPPSKTVLCIQATGRGRRQMSLLNKYGFPRTTAKKQKRVHGFQTGDMVRACVPSGKKAGCYKGRVAVRSTGNFNIKELNKRAIQGISSKYCQLVQRADGYQYQHVKQEAAIPPRPKVRGLLAVKR